MKNFKLVWIIVVSLLLGLLLFSGCDVILVTKNGETATGEKVTRQYEYTDFTGVDIGSAIRYEIRRSDTYIISITAAETAFDHIKVEEEDGVLAIYTEFSGIPWSVFQFNSSPRVVITMPLLDKLYCSGATSGTVSGFGSTDSLDVKVSGASKLKISGIETTGFTIGVSGSSNVDLDVQAENADFDISGASKVTGSLTTDMLYAELSGSSNIDLNGTATDTSMHVSGASRLKFSGFQTVNADAVFSGSSGGEIRVSGKLDAALTGASSLDYYGSPELGSINVSTSSNLKKK